MDFDIHLVRNCKDGEAYLRFYGWNPACISIGANQSFEEINKAAADKNYIELVKRPTGGRAILHSRELTYSVVISNQENISGRHLYEKFLKLLCMV